jgi:hypothetical protein
LVSHRLGLTTTSGGVGLLPIASSAGPPSAGEPSLPTGLPATGTSRSAIVPPSLVQPRAATTSNGRLHKHTRRAGPKTTINGSHLGGWPGARPQASGDGTALAFLGVSGLIALALAASAMYRRRRLSAPGMKT